VPFLCGSFAGALNSFFVCPVELVRNRLQVQLVKQIGPLGIAKQVISNFGIAGMWKGWTVTMIRDGLGIGMWFCAFTFTKKTLLNNEIVDSSLAIPLAGCSAGLCFWSVALPFDCLKSYIQTNSQPVSIIQAFSHFGNSVKRLYRGYPIAVLRGLLVIFSFFQAKEKISTPNAFFIYSFKTIQAGCILDVYRAAQDCKHAGAPINIYINELKE